MNKLILKLRRLLIILIMIDTENAGGQIRIEEQAAAIWRKVSGA